MGLLVTMEAQIISFEMESEGKIKALEEMQKKLAGRDAEINRERRFKNLLSARLQQLETQAAAISTPAPTPSTSHVIPSSSTTPATSTSSADQDDPTAPSSLRP